MVDESKEWEFFCTPERFLAVRERPDFAALVALGRASSHLRWLRHTLDGLSFDGDDSGYARRQQSGMLLATVSAFYDAQKLAQHTVGQHFRAMDEFVALRAVWTNPEFREVTGESFRGVRNDFVAHFQPDGALNALKELEFSDRCIFRRGRGSDAAQEHYVLSDAVALLSLFGMHEDAADFDARVERIVPLLARAVSEFCYRADTLITRALVDMGFEARFLDPRAGV